MNKEEYINTLCQQLRCRQARSLVADELRSHMEDQQQAFLSEGMEESEAEAAAVREMGDPVETGISLDRIHHPKMAWKLILLILLLSIAGIAAQAAAAAMFPESFPSDTLPRQILWAALGLTVMMLVCLADYSRIALRSRELYLLLLLFFLFGQSFPGASVNGSRQWIFIGGLSLNLRVAVFLFVPLYGAILYHYRGEGYRGILKSILWALPPVLQTFFQPSLMTAWMLLLIFFLLLSVSIIKDWFRVSKKLTLSILWSVTLLLPVVWSLTILFGGPGYQRDRLLVLLGLSHNTQGFSYQADLIRQMLSGSQLLGANFSSLNAASLPSPTDFILTFIITQYGILLALLLVGFMAFLFYRFFSAAMHQKNQLGMIMGCGCTLVFFFQLLLYVLSNTGLANGTALFSGTYCPFLSTGGSGTLVTCLLFGFLLSIYRYQSLLPAAPKIRGSRVWMKIKTLEN